ncbi:MAG TPA: ferritin-like domain-containing protein [Acidimicrobiales bacterium]|nr:ferritin-like domain-containing protein [Acidimicrobiales bacterium]
MAAEATPPVPGRRDVESAAQVIVDHADRLFLWDYERDRGQLVTLYNKAMGSQWNSVTDLDWSTDVDPERLVAEQESPLLAVARAAGTLPGSPLAAWSGREYTQLGIELFKANLSQFMHGEQGAMMTAAKIVETVPWIDAKYYASTQTMDEARHTEVFAKYLRTKLGDAYPMSPFLKEQIWSLLEDPRWDIAYLGMQIVIESLALAAFGDMLRRTNEPLLTKLLRYVMSDEARHVAFGVLTLSELYRDLSEAELKERQEFLVDATLNSRARATTPEVWERMGTTAAEVMPFIIEAAQKTKLNPARGFARGFFAKLVPNVRKLGLLDANNGYLREKWGDAGLLEFEFADDTGSDYESYDEVARDRAAARAAAAPAE